MKKVIFLSFFLLLTTNICLAGEVIFHSREYGPEIIRKDFELFSAGELSYDELTRILFLNKFQLVLITVENNSNEILNINPNHFTLISDQNRSYSYSSETYSLKNKIPHISAQPLQTVDVYPGTMTDGFLLFDKRIEDERPKKLYFKNQKNHIEFVVLLDPKGTAPEE